MGMTSILQCTGLKKSYLSGDGARGSRLDVLRGVDLEVAPGEIVAIVGASGSGKSTLLHLLGGLDRPTEGSVAWEGNDIFSLNDESLSAFRGTHAGFVFQFHHLLPEFTALENVMMPLLIHGTAGRAARERGNALLAGVGLSERAEHRPAELSGGEQQRVAVARALANAPKIVFADEPTGNLDSASGGKLYELISELNRENGQTFIIVTHNEAFAAAAHRRFRMADGVLNPA